MTMLEIDISTKHGSGHYGYRYYTAEIKK